MGRVNIIIFDLKGKTHTRAWRLLFMKEFIVNLSLNAGIKLFYFIHTPIQLLEHQSTNFTNRL